MSGPEPDSPSISPGPPHGVGRHRRTKIGRHRGPGFTASIWPAAQRFSVFRPQLLTAAAVALALVSAATVHAAVQGREQAGRPGPGVQQEVQATDPRLQADAGDVGAAGAGKPAAAPAAAEVGEQAAVEAGQPAVIQPAVPGGLPAATSPAAAPRRGTVVSTPPPPAPAVAPAAAPVIGPALEAQINTIIAKNSAFALGVALIDVSAGNADAPVREFGVRTKFVAASTAKILAAAAYYNLVETGQASLTAPLGASTAGNQIRWMVQQSNNESWALIMNAVGRQRLSSYAAGLGIQYQNTSNQLTAAEMARLLAALSTGRLLNPVNTAQLLSYMQNTNYETLIPAAVPPGIIVQHKYGLLFGNLHDAAILTREERRIVLVVYTRGGGMGDMAARAALIRQLAGTVTAALF